jgi:hypothetical protein
MAAVECATCASLGVNSRVDVTVKTTNRRKPDVHAGAVRPRRRRNNRDLTSQRRVVLTLHESAGNTGRHIPHSPWSPIVLHRHPVVGAVARRKPLCWSASPLCGRCPATIPHQTCRQTRARARWGRWGALPPFPSHTPTRRRRGASAQWHSLR